MKVNLTNQEVFFSNETLDGLLTMLKDHIESIETMYLPYRYWVRNVVLGHSSEYGYTASVRFETSD